MEATLSGGQPWLEIQYLTSDYCQGPPSAMIAFTDIATNWPIGYAMLSGMPYPNIACGMTYVDLNENQQCCYSSLDLSSEYGTASYTVKSFLNVLQTDNSTAPAAWTRFAPSSANGYSYCSLQSVADSSDASFQSLLLLSDGKCNTQFLGPDQSFSVICSKSGYLRLYSDVDCVNPISDEQWKLSVKDPITISTNNTGEVVAQLVTFTNGSIQSGWVTYIPSVQLIPSFQNGMEVLTIILNILALLFLCWCEYVAMLRWRTRKTTEDFLPVVAFICFLLRSILQWVIDYTVFPTCYPDYSCYIPYDTLVIFTSLFYCIATYIMVLIASETVHHLLDSSRLTKRLTTVIIIICWATLGWGRLASQICVRLTDGLEPQSELWLYYYTLFASQDSILFKWRTLSVYWTIFMFVWNVIPMNYALFQIANRKKSIGLFKSVEMLWGKDKHIFTINFAQILVITCFFVLRMIQTYTSILGNDRSHIAASSILDFFISFHCILLYFMTIRVKKLLIRLLGRSKKKSSAPPANNIEQKQEERRIEQGNDEAVGVGAMKIDDAKTVPVLHVMTQKSLLDTVKIDR